MRISVTATRYMYRRIGAMHYRCSNYLICEIEFVFPHIGHAPPSHWLVDNYTSWALRRTML